MAENLAINITADTASLRAQLAIAQADVKAYGAEVRKLAGELRSAGDDAKAGLQGQLLQAASSFERASGAAAGLRGQLVPIKEVAHEGESSLGRLKESAVELAGVFGIGFGAERLVESFKQLAEKAEHMENVASSIGVPVEEFAKIGGAIQIATGNADVAARTFQMLERNIRNALDSPTGAQSRGFEALKISAEELRAGLQKPADFLDVLADRYQRFVTNSDTPALGVAAFRDIAGRGSTDLTPALARGPEHLRELKEEFARLSGLNEKTIKDLAGTAEELNKLGIAFDGLKVAIYEGFRDPINASIESLKKLVGDTKGWVATLREIGEAGNAVSDFLNKLTGAGSPEAAKGGWLSPGGDFDEWIKAHSGANFWKRLGIGGESGDTEDTLRAHGGESPRLGFGRRDQREGGAPREEMLGWLAAHGYSPDASAAIAGNAAVESSFRTDARHAGHFGLFQWDQERQKPLFSTNALAAAGKSSLPDYSGVNVVGQLPGLNDHLPVMSSDYVFGKGKGPPLGAGTTTRESKEGRDAGATDLVKQMELMDAELTKLDPAFKNASGSVEELTRRFEQKFERSGGQLEGQREAAAREIAGKSSDNRATAPNYTQIEKDYTEAIKGIDEKRKALLDYYDQEIKGARDNQDKIRTIEAQKDAAEKQAIADRQKAREAALAKATPGSLGYDETASKIAGPGTADKDADEQIKIATAAQERERRGQDEAARLAIGKDEAQRRVADQRVATDLQKVEGERQTGQLTIDAAEAAEQQIVAAHKAAVDKILADETAAAQGSIKLAEEVANRKTEIDAKYAEQEQRIKDKATKEREASAHAIDKELSGAASGLIVNAAWGKGNIGQEISGFVQGQEKKALDAVGTKLLDASGLGKIVDTVGTKLFSFLPGASTATDSEATIANTLATTDNTSSLTLLTGTLASAASTSAAGSTTGGALSLAGGLAGAAAKLASFESPEFIKKVLAAPFGGVGEVTSHSSTPLAPSALEKVGAVASDKLVSKGVDAATQVAANTVTGAASEAAANAPVVGAITAQTATLVGAITAGSGATVGAITAGTATQVADTASIDAAVYAGAALDFAKPEVLGTSLLGGGVIPSAAGGMTVNDGRGGTLAIVHPNEMVLPSHLSTGIQDMIGRGGWSIPRAPAAAGIAPSFGGGAGGGGGAGDNYHVSISAFDGHSVERMLINNHAAVAKAFSRAVRSNNPNVPG